MAKKHVSLEPKIYVMIGSGRKSETFETWQYWEIVGALQFMGADRMTAYDAAKWLQKAKPGDLREIEPGITMEINRRQ